MNISTIEEKKQIKREKLLASAYTLFLKNGTNETSINDIVDYAGIAKGTFYLYFKDKLDIEKEVIIEKTHLLFDEAIINTNNKKITNFKDKLINILDYIINSYKENKSLVKLINKNLSYGLYNDKRINNDYLDIKQLLSTELKKYNKKIKNPDETIYIIIELVGSTLYNSIINNNPLPIDDFKPILFDKVLNIIK